MMSEGRRVDWEGLGRIQAGRTVEMGAHDERREKEEDFEKTGIGGRVWRVEEKAKRVTAQEGTAWMRDCLRKCSSETLAKADDPPRRSSSRNSLWRTTKRTRISSTSNRDRDSFRKR